MKQVLKVLIVEDDPQDAELMVITLAAEDFGLDWQRVEDEKAYLAALEQPLDLILSDWNLPKFSGPRALDLLLASRMDIPFVIVSGFFGAEAVVEALRKGADDYIHKDQMARLGQAVRRVMAEKQSRRDLLQSEQRFRLLAENALDLIFRYEIAPLHGFSYISPAVREMSGYAPEEFYADPQLIFQLAHPDERERLQAMARGELTVGENLLVRWHHRDGHILWTEIRNHAIRDSSGALLAFEGIARDITSRKQAEDAMLRSDANLRMAQHVAHVGSWTWYVQDNRLEWSDEMFSIFGVDKQGFSGDLAQVVADAIHPDDRQAVEASNRSVSVEGKPIPVEYRVIRPDGSVRIVWGEAGELQHDEDGKPYALSGIVQDITERKLVELELRRTQAELEQRVQERTEDLQMAICHWRRRRAPRMNSWRA
jgi:PAS domain S-box-containing protein